MHACRSQFGYKCKKRELARGLITKRPYEVDIHARKEGWFSDTDVWVECKAYKIKRTHVTKLVESRAHPFLFHALRAWTLGGTRPFEKTVEYLQETSEKSKLVESVVCSHLVRFLFNVAPSSKFDYSTSLFYWKSKKKREVDFVMKFENGFLPIEVKFKSQIDKKDAFGLIAFMKGGGSKSAIMLTKDRFKTSNNHIELPVSMFILIA